MREEEAVLQHEFVDHIPEELRDGVLYVCFRYATVAHRCCCGCGQEVITPLSPAQWSLTFDGESISLHPSIGNWALPCKSHYWIEHNRAMWAPRWSERRIDRARADDLRDIKGHLDSRRSVEPSLPSTPPSRDADPPKKK